MPPGGQLVLPLHLLLTSKYLTFVREGCFCDRDRSETLPMPLCSPESDRPRSWRRIGKGVASSDSHSHCFNSSIASLQTHESEWRDFKELLLSVLLFCLVAMCEIGMNMMYCTERQIKVCTWLRVKCLAALA